MLELTIVADTNDGDYVTEISEVDQETLDRLMPLIIAIKEKTGGKKFNRQNWDTRYDYRDDKLSPENLYPQFSEELIDEFNDLVPFGEYGVHSIVKIQLRELQVISDIYYLK